MPDFLHGIETINISDGIRPIQTARAGVIGLIGTAPDADAAIFPLDTPVLLANQPRKAASLGATGTLADAVSSIYDQTGAVIVVIRVAEGANSGETRANVVGNSATSTGIHAFTVSEELTGVNPRILCAPGWANTKSDGDALPPVLVALAALSQKLRAITVAAGPNTDAAEAIALATAIGSERVYLVDPLVKVNRGGNTRTEDPSAHVAGVIARMDNDQGFWWSPSNQIINGITGTSRPVPFKISDASLEANLLNEGKVATIVASDGLRLWGNRTTSGDAQTAFLSVVRTMDIIADSVAAGHRWAMDRPFSSQLLADVVGGVNAYLRQLKAQGAILGGTAWLDAELNTKETMQAGQIYVDYDIEPAAPLERLTFRVHRNADYYEVLLDEVSELLNQGA